MNVMSFKKKSKKPASNVASGSGRTPPRIFLGTYRTSSLTSPGVATGVGAPGDHGSADGTRAKLLELFGQIEYQFELLHGENTALRERVEKLEQLVAERNSVEMPQQELATPSSTTVEFAGSPNTSAATPFKKKSKNSGPIISKKLIRSKKGRSGGMDCSPVNMFLGHRDGVWQVTHARNASQVIGTASADGTACVWDADSALLLYKYLGHSGSVNALSFHPHENLACTASGDTTVHIWKYHFSTPHRLRSGSNPGDKPKHDSSGEDRYGSEDELEAVLPEPHPTGPTSPVTTLKSPIVVLPDHKAPVMSCDWLPDGSKLVTASWDHTAKLWDFESAQVIHTLEGHDQELTHVCVHPKQQILATSSLDMTFRLWDFRAPPIHSVSIFQGHAKAVNAAVFSLRENVVSGSDDHTVKIWDLRNMRSPVDTIRMDCGVNRLSVSHDDRALVAVPLDNRHIKIYDLSGNRVAHVPRRNHLGHRRMVYSVGWSPDIHGNKCSLYSAGFDAKVIGWKMGDVKT